MRIRTSHNRRRGKPFNPKINIAIGVIIIILGIVIAINILQENADRKEFRNNAETTYATVIDIYKEMDGRVDNDAISYNYYAVVEYTVDGKTYEKTILANNIIRVGDIITIYYDPKNPSYSLTEAIAINNIGPIIIVIFMSFFGIAWITITVITQRTQNNRADETDMRYY